MAKLLDSLTIDGVTNKVHEQYTLSTAKETKPIPANTSTEVARLQIDKKGLYLLKAPIRFLDGSTTGERIVLFSLARNGSARCTESQRASNRYGVYMFASVSDIVDATPFTYTLNALSSMACNVEVQIVAERIFELGSNTTP